MILHKGSAVVTSTCPIRGRYPNVIVLAADQVTERAVGGEAAASDAVTVARGFYIVAGGVGTRAPGHMSCSVDQLAGHVGGRARL